ncbi:DUF3951 domain-containing protein [Halobacillus fulvus]|nr:DUF3951 domain-containing protein [Halobacillus fulvus]
MLLNAIGFLIVGIATFILMIIVGYKVFVKKQRVDTANAYTPFDYITGQSNDEFQEGFVLEEKNGKDRKNAP